MNQDRQTIQTGQDARYLETIKRRFQDRQNTIRQLRLKQTTLEWVSVFFNAVSVLTASYFVISLTDNYAGIWKIAFASVLIAVLVMNEYAKRWAINEGAEGERSWFFAVAVLVGISFYASYQGGERFMVERSIGPTLEHNPAIDSLNQRIAAVDSDVANWKRQTWKGKIVTDARRSIAKLEQTKIALIEQRTALEQRDLSRNDETEQAHRSEIRSFGVVFGGVAGVMDVLLVFCLLMAKSAEQSARFLLGLTDANANEKTVHERSRERERPNEKANVLAPAPASAQPAVNRELAEYSQRTGQQIADLKAQLARERMENERMKKEAERNVRANEQANANANAELEQIANDKPNEPRTKKANESPNKNRVPKWVSQAKMMHKSGMSYGEIAVKLKKAKSTVHKWVNS